MKKQIKELVEFLVILAKRFEEDRLLYAASALTFTTLLSLVPLMTVVLGILSAFTVFHNIHGEIQNFVFSNFVPASGEIVQKYLNTFASQTQKLSAINLVFLIGTGVLMVFTIEGAMNSIWHVEERRYGLSAWLRYWAMLTLAPILVGASIATTSYIISLPLVAGAVSKYGMMTLLVESVPLVMLFVALTFLYSVIPNCYVNWKHAVLGAFVATVFFEVAKKGFLFYITRFPTYQLLYGALATIPIFLLWVYLSWIIVLFGAVLNNAYATRKLNKDFGRIDGFFHAFLWLGGLWQAQKVGQSLSVSHLQRQFPGHYHLQPQELMKILQEYELVVKVAGQRYVLSRDFSSFTLSDLYSTLPWKFILNEKMTHEKHLLVTYYKKASFALNESLQVNMNKLYEDFLE